MSEGHKWDKGHIIKGSRMNHVYKQTLGTRAWATFCELSHVRVLRAMCPDPQGEDSGDFTSGTLSGFALCVSPVGLF